MNINYFRYFLLATETGSLSQTAEIVNIAQLATTKQMQGGFVFPQQIY